jgi:hypothetical protein
MNIYEEAIEELKRAWNGNELTYPKKTIKALERAKKVEELLVLYREYYSHIPYSDNPRIKYCEHKIDEMEDKLEELK